MEPATIIHSVDADTASYLAQAVGALLAASSADQRQQFDAACAKAIQAADTAGFVKELIGQHEVVLAHTNEAGTCCCCSRVLRFCCLCCGEMRKK